MSFNIASEELVCVLNLYNKVNVKEKKKPVYEFNLREMQRFRNCVSISS
jgi:hypothetical protein